MDHRDAPPTITMSEAEFEEVMGRNRTVSSSAISRAVADAATGR
jgi:cleavage and polyadenylation specificity factor subunit 6/7